MRLQLHGTVDSWNDEKGYGFITPLAGGERVFVHITAVRNRSVRPSSNQEVYYSLSHDKQGRVCASDVLVIGNKPTVAIKATRILVALVVGSLFLVAAGAVELVLNHSFLVAAIYLAASVLTFLFYAADKNAARIGAWRVPEANLHLLSLVGGWPGAMLAQQTLRHKSKKREFRFVFWITVMLNIAATIWLFSPKGLPFLTIAKQGLLEWFKKILSHG